MSMQSSTPLKDIPASCPVCVWRDMRLLHQLNTKTPSDVSFSFYRCQRCKAHFALPRITDEMLYNTLYSSRKPAESYYRPLYEQACAIKTAKDPLRFLSDRVHTFYAITHAIRNTSKLKILEVGCGYGYLTWALNQRGHHARGIDVSDAAVTFARAQFGPMYERLTIDEFAAHYPNERFDLIVSTEVIEHVPYPSIFFERCISLLEKKGRFVITTPNKDYYPAGTIWGSDLPPIHLTFFGSRAFNILAEHHHLDLSFINFSSNLPKNEQLNTLLSYFLSRKNSDVAKYSALSPENSRPMLVRGQRRLSLKLFFRSLLIGNTIIRLMCNALYHVFFRKLSHDSTLAVIFWKTS